MTIQAWTFLISRNQSIDYKTVVAPDFIAQAKIRSLLLKISDDDFTESEEIAIREVHGSEVGNFTVVFRSVKARSQDIGENENKILKDPFGRTIYWMEGLVFQKSRKELQHKIGKSHLDQAHRELQEDYKKFWNKDELSVSDRIDLVEVESETDNKLRVLEPLVITPKPQLPEHRLPEKQEIEKYNYPPRKPRRNKTNLFRVILIAITALLLIWIFREGIRLGLGSQSPSKPQPTSITLYMTQEDVPIEVNSPNDVIEKLNTLKEEHETAWIWLNGSLDVESSLADQIKTEVDKQNKEEKTIVIVPDKNNKLTITNQPIGSVSASTGDGEKKKLKIYIINYPIVSAIALLKEKKVTSSNLKATIIEPILPKP